MAKRKITKVAVDALRPGNIIADPEVRGFVARCLPSGSVTYGLRYRVGGRQRWHSIGLHGRITPDQARRLAKKYAGEVADNRDPSAERSQNRARDKSTVNALLDTFLDRYARKNLRSSFRIERVFDTHVRPHIGGHSIFHLRRSDVVEMLDAIEDESGPAIADWTLAYVRKAFNWWAARDDSFIPPIVPGMARTKLRERARKRILDDDEIRDVYKALKVANLPEPFQKLVRALLLTGQRRNEVARMRWEEIAGSTWVIPAERRKTRELNTVPLTKAVLQLLGKPQKSGFVFSTSDGKRAFSGFSKAKRALDQAITTLREEERREPMPPWVLHDLRRTARSLMSRAGVSADIGERVLGHTIGGVRGIYDRHSFFDEKADALERLALLVGRILNPPADNVVALGVRR